MKTMANNKKKSFLNKFLLATSSIGMLASMESFAADVVPALGVLHAYTRDGNDWRNNGRYNPQDGDNIILTADRQSINVNNDINLGNINLYGYNPDILIIQANNPTRQVSINNIINVNNPQANAAVRNALGFDVRYGGGNNAKVDILLHHQVAGKGALVEDSKLVIKGNDISAVSTIRFNGASVELVFENNNITVDNLIYSNGIGRGRVTVAGNNVVFAKPIGHDGINVVSISELQVENGKTATLKDVIYANDITLGQNSKLIVDSSKQNVNVWSGVAINNAKDDQGIIQVRGDAKNTIIFRQNIGLNDHRVAEIKIENGKKTEFKQDVYAKKIKVVSNDVEFQEKLDMTKWNQDNRGNRTNLVHTGNLEFTDHGKVKFYKDFVGNITTSQANQGKVTFVNTPDIYEIGAQNKRIEKLIFTGNHVHKLHKNIYAKQVDFDAGTYNIHTNPVTIDGNAKINGSTFDLKHNLILNGNVEFSGNITFNVTGGYSVFFQNNLPSVIAGTNIVININGAHPATAAAAASIFRVNGGAFVPEGHKYNAATGTMNFRNGLQVQQAGQAVAQEVTHAQARVNAQTQAVQGHNQQAQVQITALAQQHQQKQNELQDLPRQRQERQARIPVLTQQRRQAQDRADAFGQQVAQAQAAGQPQAQIDALVVQQQREQTQADELNGQRIQTQAEIQRLVHQQPRLQNEVQILVQQQQQVQDEALVVQQTLNADAQVLRQELVEAQARAPVQQNQRGGQQQVQQVQQVQQGGQQQAQQQQNQQGGQQQQAQNQQQNQQNQQGGQQQQAQNQQQNQQNQQVQQAQQGGQQQNQQVGQQQNQQAQQQQNQQGGQQQQAQNQQQNQQAQQNQQGGQQQNQQAQQQQNQQAQAQQRQANEVRVAEEYVNKPKPQKLAEAINNIIVVHTEENTFVAEAQKGVIRETSALIMKNPEKAVEFAKEVSNNAQLQEAAKTASDDTFVKGKTKQEQSVLFVAVLANGAAGKEKEALQHTKDQGTRVHDTARITNEAVSHNINNHLSGGNMIAVAAGDEDDNNISTVKKGVWVAGTFGSSNQGESKGVSGYSGKVSGGTIGGDLHIGENSLVGIAYSRMNSDFNFKDKSTGDSLKADSDIISLYGQQQFNSGLLLQEIFSAGNSKVITKNKRFGKIAQGKYTSKAYSAEGNVGYQFRALDSINLIPNVGVRYNNYKDDAYNETSSGVGNLNVAAKSGSLVTGIAGVKMTAPKLLSNDTQIVPGLHASVENNFSNKQPKVKARFIWADNYFENNAGGKLPKVGYNVGASLLTAHKNVEVLATYNCNLRSKYTSHQGSLKLKIMF